MTLVLNIDITDAAWTGLLPGLDPMMHNAAEATLAHAAPQLCQSPATVEIGFTFADDALLQQLNRDHRGKDKPTNVLSFPLVSVPVKMTNAPQLLGDVVFSRQTIAGEAARDGKTIADHTMHLTVHGILHLLGHDHESDADADAMEAREIEILATLGIANPYILLA